MPDRTIAESTANDVQWIKKLLGWGLAVGGGGLLVLFAVGVHFEKSIHAAIITSQADTHRAIAKGHNEVANVVNKLNASRIEHALGMAKSSNRQDTFQLFCCGEVDKWKSNKPKGK